jgi:hypothetical protein
MGLPMTAHLGRQLLDAALVARSWHGNAERTATVTWFCPSCFAELPETAGTCLQCGADLVSSGRDFEAALVGALRHPLHDRRLMAARILGRRRAVAAVPALISVADDSRDPYLAAEAVRALVAIGTPDGLAIARYLASDGPVVAKAAARKALAG